MSDIKVIGSFTSPFVRVVRTMCEELKLPYDLENTGFFKTQDKDQAQLVSENNPLMKIPILVVDGQPLIESRIILQYLAKNYPLPDGSELDLNMSIEKENLLSTVYGMIDAGILLFIIGGEGNMKVLYLERSLERIKSGLAYMDASPVLGKTYGFPELALVCALDWFKKRNVVDWTGYKNLVSVHAKISKQPALVATRIPENV